MLHLLRSLAFCFWCAVLLHHRAMADEEAPWGPTPPRETSSWWPKPPSLSSPRFRMPFSGISDDDGDAAVLVTTGNGLPNVTINARLFVTRQPSSNHSGNSKDRLLEPSGSGDGGSFDASEASGSSAQPTSATNTGSESLPTGTPDFPRGDNGSLVPDSYTPTSASVRNSLSTDIATSASSPEQHAARTRPPWGTTQAAGSTMGAAQRHLPGDITQRIYSTVPPETTVPTALTWAEAHTTTVPGLVEGPTSPLTGLPSPGPITPPESPQTTFVESLQYSIVPDTTVTRIHGPWDVSDPSVAEATSGREEERAGVITSSTGIDRKPTLESLTSTAPSKRVKVPIARDPPGKEDKEAEETEEGGIPSTPPAQLLTASQPRGTGIPPESLYSDDLTTSLTEGPSTFLPDCNKERSWLCNLSDTWESTTTSDLKPVQNTSAANQSNNPFLVPAPLMLVPLYTDWNKAMAAWGLAWEAHVYGTGCAFAMLTLASALNLLCLPLRCPSGCGYFALVSLFLVAAGATRSFSLLYDAYGHQDRLPSAEASLLLYEAPFPCMTAAFGLVFLLLSMRSRMQLSYSAFQRPCFLACLVFLHFAAAFGPVTLQKFYQQKPPLCLFFSLISRGAFVALATFLSAAYFVFYIYVRADSKHIYHLNNTSPTPAERYNRCPFAESRDWDRAAVTVCLSALLSLACAGLQLYAILNAVGVAGGEEVFHPWPWWAFQFSCRLCELGVCLTLALVVSQPVYCADHLPAAGSCWTELLASKSPMLPGSYQWTLSQQEKLAIVDTAGLGETESLPLYTLMDERLGSSLNGLDLLYHSNRALAYRNLEFDLDLQGSAKPGEGGAEEPSGGSSYTSDSTTDLRPPSPINLRRSIDEALFSEALFPMSLFSSAGPFRCSDLSINNHCALPGNGLCDPLSTDPGLYRTSSCTDVASNTHRKTQRDTIVGAPPSPSLSSSSSCSSPEHWRGSSSSSSLYRASIGGSSLVLCESPERQAPQPLQNGGSGHMPSYQTHTDLQRSYHTLGATSQESLDLDTSEADRSVQEEFVNVCRQVDAVSICSETIDL